MEIWRVGHVAAQRPKVLSIRNGALAIFLHVALFVLFFLYSIVHGLFNREEEIIPIDLTVIVNENLDGKEDEPPPLRKPDPPPPPEPKPQPKPKEPEKPKELEQIVTNIVAKVDKNEEKKVEKPKPPEKKPEQPKKTAKELLDERIKKMRESATMVTKTEIKIEVHNVPSGDGRTAKKTLSNAEIEKRLMAGYKPGTSEQLAKNDEQLGYSLIKMAFEAKWDEPPWTDTLKPMTIRVWFGGGGRVMRYTLESSSGDARADQSIKSAASRVGSVPGLSAAFIDKYRSSGVPVRFTVKPK